MQVCRRRCIEDRENPVLALCLLTFVAKVVSLIKGVLELFHREKMAETWTFNSSKLEHACYFPASLMVVAYLLVIVHVRTRGWRSLWNSNRNGFCYNLFKSSKNPLKARVNQWLCLQLQGNDQIIDMEPTRYYPDCWHSL